MFKGNADLEEMYKDPFTINKQNTKKFPIHDDQTHWKMRKPKYVDADQLKECLTYYYLANGFSLCIYRSSKDQVIARCEFRPEKLKDVEKGSKGRQSNILVIFLNEEYTCVRNFKYGTLVKYMWIGKQFGIKIRQNPEIKLHEIADLVMKKYKCIVSPSQCRNAKKFALNKGETTTEDHYTMIRSYGKAILESNYGSTVKLGCRPVIALDGCFLKKPNVGEILTVVRRNGNNYIYPISWAIVNVENKDNWSWFLQLLGEYIDMPIGNGLTLISDQHKGLIEAVKDVYLIKKRILKHGQELSLGYVVTMKVLRMVLVGASTQCANGNIFEVRNSSEAFRVDEQLRTYTRRMWQLTGHNKKSSNKPIIIPPKKQPGKRGRPKKNVENVESRGDATFSMDESSSQAKQRGDATGTNMGLVGVETGTNVDSVGVESSAGNETVRSACLGDFVSVKYEGTTTATRLKGGLGFRVRRRTSEGTPAATRGRGGQTLRLRVRRGTSEGTSNARR
uniref:Pentatricopeptide repeat-containing protein n=1 Tax=Tanacetum cinerariifolium TaxID=118510 RepID=A0A699JZA2_TANCI|nr:pentatricopeptide repeat-containing protein [Tanacetum cinerariifolium]